MKRSKGMTLVELLIAMGISVMIMASTFVIVQFSSSTYDSTQDMIVENNNTYDAVSIINQYIRSSSFCAVSDNGKSLYVTVDKSTFGGNAGEKHTVRLAFDVDDKILFIDRMDGSERMIVSKDITRIEWTIKGSGVKYKVLGLSESGQTKTLVSGYAYKRGQ